MPPPVFLLAFDKKFVIIMAMQNNSSKKPNNLFGDLFGQPTRAKASGLAFSVATVLPTVLSFTLLIALSVFGLAQTEDYQQKNWYLYANYLLPQISFAIVAFLYLRYRQIPVKSAVKSQKCKPKYFIIALLLQIGLFGLSELNALFLSWLEGFGYTDAGIALPGVEGLGFVGVLLVIGVFASVLEEIVFRGALLDGLKNSFSTPVAVLLCGALFAIFHQNPAQTVYQFCCGTAFALVAVKSGSVLPTTLAHFINNTVILILYKVGVAQFTTPVFIAVVTVSAVCLIATLGYLIFIDKTEQKQDVDKSEKKNFFLYSAVGIALCALTWLLVLFTGI